MRKGYLFLILCFSAIYMTGCKEDAIIAPEISYTQYFQDKVGTYILYNCDSIVYDDFNGTVDTFRFQIKEYYESEFTDNSGRKAIRIERKKRDDTTSWFIKDVWSLVKTSKQVEKVEEDVRFIKLNFPVKSGKVWNVNALNSLGDQEVEYQEVHKPFSTGTLSFDSTITVVNTDPVNLISEFRNTEVFAMNVGLVYKRFVDVDYVVPTPEIKKGVVFTMSAVEFGVE
jgi:hypothetical protein